ncbi:MAG: TOBE domain-containing protein [Pseudomonadota bacterium]
MRISARNQLKGKIVAIEHGATTTHMKIDVGGNIITAAITKTSAAIVKASDVMVGVT